MKLVSAWLIPPLSNTVTLASPQQLGGDHKSIWHVHETDCPADPQWLGRKVTEALLKVTTAKT